MQLIRSYSIQPRCTIYSLAMLLNTTVEELEEELGYVDVKPFFENGECRAIHPQEMVDACLKRGRALVTIEARPAAAHYYGGEGPIFDDTCAQVRMHDYLSNYAGLIVGISTNDRYHMVAWDGERVFDCNKDAPYFLEKLDYIITSFLALV